MNKLLYVAGSSLVCFDQFDDIHHMDKRTRMLLYVAFLILSLASLIDALDEGLKQLLGMIGHYLYI